MFAWLMGASTAIKVALSAGALVVLTSAVAIPIAVANTTQGSVQSSGSQGQGSNVTPSVTPSNKSSKSGSPSPTPTPTPTKSASPNAAPVEAPVAPSAPRSLVVSSAEGDWAALAWATPSNSGTSPITSYNIYSSTNGGGNWSYLGSTGQGQNNFTVGGLGSATSYIFAVDASSDIGSSNFSNIASHDTVVFTPSEPVGFTITCGTSGARSDSSGTYVGVMVGCITYSAPTSSGISPVTGYEGGYTLDGGATWTITALNSSFPMMSAEFNVNTGIDPQTAVFGIRAVNAYGAGPWTY